MARRIATSRRLRPGDTIPQEAPRRYRTRDGYWVLRWRVAPYEYVEALEHRVVDGRVTTAPHIHHRNHDKRDNRPENLAPVTPKEHRRAHSSIDYDTVWAQYQAGRSLPDLADEYGATTGALSRGLRGRGRTLRGPADWKRLDLDRTRVVDLFISGMRPRAIAALFGVSDTPIRRILSEEGVAPHRTGRPRT